MDPMSPKPVKKPVSTGSKIATIAGVVIAAVLTTLLLHHGDRNKYNDAGAKAASQLTAPSNPWQTYTATQDGFKIQFPDRPTARTTVQSVQGIQVPNDLYELDKSNGYWAVSVNKYPAQVDMSDTTARLQGALNGAVQNTPQATLVKSSPTKIAGKPAITGLIHAPHDGKTIDEHLTCMLSGNTLYSFIGVNASQADFDKFTDSFQLR